ncbi:MAG: helix-turn-helix domain-containing protein, partial [Candidatus Omnitrophota bacterium]|nr:helix-turn-helix domain-containing protein [Candidatus Omnitrophota bacterium]
MLAESDSIEPGNFSPDNLKLYGEKIDVTQPLDKGVSFEEITKEIEKDLIKRALECSGGNKIKAAESLKMNK